MILGCMDDRSRESHVTVAPVSTVNNKYNNKHMAATTAFYLCVTLTTLLLYKFVNNSSANIFVTKHEHLKSTVKDVENK